MTSKAERQRARKIRADRERELREAGILPPKRDRSGRIIDNDRSDATETVITARLRHLGWRDTPESRKAARDDRLGSQIGRLQYFRRITPRELEAGWRYSALCGKHDGVLGLPRRTASGGRYGEAYGGATRDADPETVWMVKAEYDDALAALRGSHARAQSEVTAICVEEVERAARVEILRMGLRALAAHFKVDVETGAN